MSEDDLTPVPDAFLGWVLERARKLPPGRAQAQLMLAEAQLFKRGDLTPARRDLIGQEVLAVAKRADDTRRN